jgi:hypothetical protein
MADNDAENPSTSGVSRRKVLATASATGLLVGVPGVSGAAKEDRVRVPQTKRGPKDVHKWMEVPREWHEHHKRAKSAVQQVTEQHMGRPGVYETGLVAGDKKHGGKRGFKIEVIIDPSEEDNIPNEQNGIKVETVEGTGDYVRLCSNTGSYDNVPGGVNVYDEYYTDPPGLATLGYPVDFGGTRHLVTASHTFAGCDIDGGDSTYTVANDLGYVSTGSVPLDYVVTDASQASCKNRILSGGTEYTPTDYATESEIGNRVTSPFDGHTAMGCTTGETTGGIGKKASPPTTPATISMGTVFGVVPMLPRVTREDPGSTRRTSPTTVPCSHTQASPFPSTTRATLTSSAEMNT